MRCSVREGKAVSKGVRSMVSPWNRDWIKRLHSGGKDAEKVAAVLKNLYRALQMHGAGEGGADDND